MSRRRALAAGDDEGAILVLTLAFLLLFGLFIGALLGQVGANFATTEVVRSRDVKNLNADAGIDYGLIRLRQDSTLCPDAPSGVQDVTGELSSTGGLKVNGGRSVTVTCQTLSGSATGASGYAAILTGSSPIDTSNGGDKLIKGPVWARGPLSLAKDLIVEPGDVDQFSSGTCPAEPANLNVAPDPPYKYGCTSDPAPDPPHALPAQKKGGNPAGTDLGSCRMFKPGVYTTAPHLVGKNYFTSGVYVFSNIGNWSSNKKDIYGGAQAPGENLAVTSGAPCATDADAPNASGNGTGVEFIFEGNSTLDIGSTGRLELFRRRAASPSGTEGISLFAGKAWSGSQPVLQVAGGSTPHMAIHGLVYAPSASVELYAPNSSSAPILGGIVADSLIASSGSATGLAISTKSGRDTRVVVLTATAPGASAGEASTTSTAVVALENDDQGRHLSVLSRRVS